MSAELELRWLKTDKVRGASKRFAEFCKEDVRMQAELDNFDIEKYQDAIKIVLGKLSDSSSVEELFNAD
ncbi:MAG: hypothetical protein V7749_09100 [Cocleimonas sp.]